MFFSFEWKWEYAPADEFCSAWRRTNYFTCVVKFNQHTKMLSRSKVYGWEFQNVVCA